jgi:hypothetical protein
VNFNLNFHSACGARLRSFSGKGAAPEIRAIHIASWASGSCDSPHCTLIRSKKRSAPQGSALIRLALWRFARYDITGRMAGHCRSYTIDGRVISRRENSDAIK